MVTLTTDGDIIVAGEQIGRLVYRENHIRKIEIHHTKRGEGYATAALETYLDRIDTQQYDQVTTTPATTPSIIHILEKLGFEKVEDPARHDFLSGSNEERYLASYFKELGYE